MVSSCTREKKAKVQDPYLAQMTGFFETEFFSFSESLQPSERSRQFGSTNLLIELNQHGFSQDFVNRFVDERLKLMQETKHSALLNYAQSHQHRPLAKEIIQSFLQAKPEGGCGEHAREYDC